MCHLSLKSGANQEGTELDILSRESRGRENSQNYKEVIYPSTNCPVPPVPTFQLKRSQAKYFAVRLPEPNINYSTKCPTVKRPLAQNHDDSQLSFSLSLTLHSSQQSVAFIPTQSPKLNTKSPKMCENLVIESTFFLFLLQSALGHLTKGQFTCRTFVDNFSP